MRYFWALMLAVIPWVVEAQSAPTEVSVAVSPATGDLATAHLLRVANLPSNVSVPIVLLAPDGSESTYSTHSDTSGSLAVLLSPPGTWHVGVYRAAVGMPDGRSMSVTFTASDGSPHLLAEPDLPSPTSALMFMGTGLPAGTELALEVDLTGAQGVYRTQVTTDPTGAFDVLVWPQQAGVPFFAAGDYRVALPQEGLATSFRLREHPISATLDVDTPVQPGADLRVHLQHYVAGRYVWLTYEAVTGGAGGELLLGPVALDGSVSIAVPESMPPGQYLIASPYDWGENEFTILAPPPTPTATATATATPTVTPVPTRTTTKKKCRRGHTAAERKKPCKKKRSR